MIYFSAPHPGHHAFTGKLSCFEAFLKMVWLWFGQALIFHCNYEDVLVSDWDESGTVENVCMGVESVG